ncbi:MAG TPA: LamG-like jellyroll fold domain-containing protein, partial [Armatimonadota bacterium]|nr:LamG-like jellyroll fold domain-containing protein [Armatimonadota bacterium]
PIHEWHLGEGSITGKTLRAAVGGVSGSIEGDVQKFRAPSSVDFAGTGHVLLAAKGQHVELPQQELTAEAWVCLRAAGEWGGFVGYVQDNGAYEKGWVLGNRQSRFSMALSSVGADDGDGLLTYLSADRDIPLRKWSHVVGTYDGARLCVYVDGELAGSTDAHSGDILYDDTDFVLAAYKDDNEFFPVDGAIESVAIYDVALTDEQVMARYDATRERFADADPLPLAPGDMPEPMLIDGPRITFENQRDAIIEWNSREPTPSIVEYRAADVGEPVVRRDARPKRRHSVRLQNLPRDTEHVFRIRVGADGEATDEYSLNTEFDFSVPDLRGGARPFPEDDLSEAFARAARHILKTTGIDRGYCIDYGCGEGRLAFEIAKRSKLQVVGVSTDLGAIKRGRRALLESGNYGGRITLRHVDSLDTLPFPDMCANLIVSGEAVSAGQAIGSTDEVRRKLRADGGAALIGPLQGQGSKWLSVGRLNPLEGAGDWPHAYGTTGQTVNSGDELVVGTAGETLEVQWFGLPGPNAMIDRQVRMQGPVSAAGRVYTQGNNRVIAQDAYNGTIIWSMEIPHLRRTNIPRNTGNVCCNRESLFVAARDHCWVLDGATGALTDSFHVTGDESDTRYDWGYVAVDGDTLFGSAVRRGNMEDGYVGPQYWFDTHSGTSTFSVCSDALFANRLDGERRWTYEGGLIVNPTISMSDGRIVFVEARGDDALDAPGRQLGAEIWTNAWLVALDASTGQLAWETKLDVPQQPIVTYVVCHDGLACLMMSYAGKYDVQMVKLADGTSAWRAEHAWRSDNHGHHIQHPVVAQGRLFLEPNIYEWTSGEPVDIQFPAINKCGTIGGAANLLHYRDFNDEVWDLTTDIQSEFNKLRSNCWVGMISGSGLLMSPESGGGCGCGWPIYTSLTYRSKDDY